MKNIIKSLLTASIITFCFTFIFSRVDYFYKDKKISKSSWELSKNEDENLLKLDKKEWILREKKKDLKLDAVMENGDAGYSENYDFQKEQAENNIKDYYTRRVYQYLPLLLILVISFSASYLYFDKKSKTLSE